MRFFNTVIITVLLVSPTLSTAESKEGKSFLPEVQSFILIEDVNRQAEAWATCSAVWDIMAIMTGDDSKSQAEQYSNLSNGAKMAVAMSYVSDLAKANDSDKGRFNATWTFAKTALESMPQVQMTSMLADLEQRGMDSWMPDFGATMKACTDNLQAQQVHVDSWRGLATSGLLEFE
jgi:hypothetical protein